MADRRATIDYHTRARRRGRVVKTKGSARDGSASTLRIRIDVDFQDDELVGWWANIVLGLGVGNSRKITAYDNSNHTCTIAPDWNTGAIPDEDSDYTITRDPQWL